VVGWTLERTLATRLTRSALERAIAARQPAPGLVHHSDRGVQYASDEYVQRLQAQQMITSMSRPANPYNNASCESFMKTLKRRSFLCVRDDGHQRKQHDNFQRFHVAHLVARHR
jgi:putative transposase